MTVPSDADIKKKGGVKPSISAGDVFTHPLYGDFVVINYEDAHKVSVYFTNTGYINLVSVSEIKKGTVRDHTQVRVYGVGINDAGYPVVEKSRKGRGSSNKWKCPFWVKWSSMLERCYSGKHHPYHSTYVCDEWLTFSNFKSWMEKQDWGGKELDKDLLGNGKLYSPDTCCFLPKEINTFLIDCNRPLCGVTQAGNKFKARCINPFSLNKESSRYIGVYDTKEEAYQHWKSKKCEYARIFIETIILDPRISNALREKFQ